MNGMYLSRETEKCEEQGGQEQQELQELQELEALCETFKQNIEEGGSRSVEPLVLEAMERFPESAVPHNLMGVLLERERKHTQAMRHFRAAYALDPSYEPAKHNLEVFGGMRPFEKAACAPCDCRKEKARFASRFYAVLMWA